MKNIWKLLGGLGGIIVIIGCLISFITYMYQITSTLYFDPKMLITQHGGYILSNLFFLIGYLLITIGFFTAKTSSN